MRRWFRDTLFLRLFVLMWVALVVSHIAAFGVITSSWLPFGHRGVSEHDGDGDGRHDRGRGPRVPVFPSLPPTPGLHLGPPTPPQDGAVDRGEPHRGPRSLSTPLLITDYLIRLVVIAAAAWLGARWLAAPVRRLVDASAKLGVSLGVKAWLEDRRKRVALDEHADGRTVAETVATNVAASAQPTQ